MKEGFYAQDSLIGVTPCQFCGGVSDRWMATGFSCKPCFDFLHDFGKQGVEVRASMLKEIISMANSFRVK